MEISQELFHQEQRFSTQVRAFEKDCQDEQALSDRNPHCDNIMANY